MMRRYIAILALLLLALVPARAELTVNELVGFGVSVEPPPPVTSYTSPNRYLLSSGLAGETEFKLWGAGGGGAGGDTTSSSPNPAGGSGGSGSFLGFKYTLDAAERYAIIVGAGGDLSSNGTNGTGGADGGGLTGLAETAGAPTTVEADSTEWTDTVGTVSKANNGDGTWTWTYPTSSLVTSNAGSLSVANSGKPYLVRARIRLDSGTPPAGLRFIASGQTAYAYNFGSELINGSYVTVEGVIYYEHPTTSSAALKITCPSTATPPVLTIDWIELEAMEWIGVAAGGGGGGGASTANVNAWGGGGAGGGTTTAGRAGLDGGNTTGGNGGGAASSSAAGAGGTGGGTGDDGQAGHDSMGGNGGNATTVPTHLQGGQGDTATSNAAGGGAGSNGKWGGGGGENAQTTSDGGGGGGSGSSGVDAGATDVTSTAGTDGASGADGVPPGTTAAVNTGDAHYQGNAGRGGRGGGYNASGAATQSSQNGDDGLAVMIGP